MLCSGEDGAVISHGARASLTLKPQGLETSRLGSRLQQHPKNSVWNGRSTQSLHASLHARLQGDEIGMWGLADLCFSSMGRVESQDNSLCTSLQTWMFCASISPKARLIQISPPSLPQGIPVSHSPQQVTVTVQWSSCPQSRSHH